MFEASFLDTLLLTLKLASITVAILFFIGIFLGYILAFVNIPYKVILNAVISLPLVLPPSVLGFYLLLTFSPNYFLGSFLQEYFELSLVFSFQGLVIASLIFNLPFMVNPIQSAFTAIPKNLIEMSYTLGKSKFRTLLSVILPNSKAGILTGCVLSFAHTVGEFGVVMMIGGNRQETHVASIAIYTEVEVGNYALAHQYAFTLFIISFIVLCIVYAINKRFTNG
ncbi:molybdenum ABC transporter permease subunit [Helicobacter monodelphidis]|uniref:molybdate ABC transporter permease subunit n=1 Tax=Helicobacter sp. 15-1451 TaxID=2004995 RepID=UPI000DCDAB4D|nr:molybdate ABC transporter permease subunit [Helicobacter sp. 15-1451]RAX58205.1 molybdenum ABC transporter permease subunit [Helicobacter sp. 15-1451]